MASKINNLKQLLAQDTQAIFFYFFWLVVNHLNRDCTGSISRIINEFALTEGRGWGFSVVAAGAASYSATGK